MNKRELRVKLRKMRVDMPRPAQLHAALALQRIAMRQYLLLRHHRIGFYLPFQGEMSLLPLMNHSLWQGKSCHLPVVPVRGQKQLWFSPLSAEPSWYHNRFGIHEHWSPRNVRAKRLDLLFIPLVAFDEAGYRLGMGGGFYDTSLAYLRRRKVWRKPYLVGVGYEYQKVAQIPRDPWDVPLDAVITEKRLYRFRL